MQKKFPLLPNINPHELAEKGINIYNQKLKSELEKTHQGDYVAIEVDSGEYFIGLTQIEAILKAKRKFPHTVFYMVKVGSRAVVHYSSGHQPFSYGSVL